MKKPQIANLIEIARRLEGLSRHASTHAAGVVIAPKPLTELIPLAKSSKEELTTQYSMKDLEAIGLLKMDFLALTTLTILDHAVKRIREETGIEVDLAAIPLTDEEVYALFSEGKTNGIFQFESGCYVVVSDVSKNRMGGQEVHDSYVGLQKVERDFRAMKTGLLEVRPVFVRKESRTRGHVFACMLALKVSREMERRVQAAFGTTDSDPHTVTLSDALASLSRLCLLHYPIDADTTVTRLPKPDARQKDILAALGVAMPEK